MHLYDVYISKGRNKTFHQNYPMKAAVSQYTFSIPVEGPMSLSSADLASVNFNLAKSLVE